MTYKPNAKLLPKELRPEPTGAEKAAEAERPWYCKPKLPKARVKPAPATAVSVQTTGSERASDDLLRTSGSEQEVSAPAPSSLRDSRSWLLDEIDALFGEEPIIRDK